MWTLFVNLYITTNITFLKKHNISAGSAPASAERANDVTFFCVFANNPKIQTNHV